MTENVSLATPPAPKRAWDEFIVYAVAPGAALVASLLNGFLERAFNGREYQRNRAGEANSSSTRDRVYGEGRDIVTLLSGGLAGLIVSTVVTTSNLWAVYGLAVVLVVMCGGIVGFHNWARRLSRAASVDAWEPGVPPGVALQSLRDEWLAPRRAVWPTSAARALRGERFRLSAALRDEWRGVLWQIVPWTSIAIVFWAVLSNKGWLATLIAGIVIAVALFAPWASLAQQAYSLRYYRMRVQMRSRRLNRQLTAEREQVSELNAKLDSLSEQGEHIQRQLALLTPATAPLPTPAPEPLPTSLLGALRMWRRARNG
ncbi:hypothetical protein CGZ98_06105 [Enemella evansiae]|uniref:hypothetical protein n=1 Tax=Enemella evansiae TaxID=2016499 RepID=UPI000B96DB09|nr:hypothetical protein [Enemella evansiae]OYO13115.1 hypothetical protein CGZ98_06105 [Enemella evansiae]